MSDRFVGRSTKRPAKEPAWRFVLDRPRILRAVRTNGAFSGFSGCFHCAFPTAIRCSKTATRERAATSTSKASSCVQLRSGERPETRVGPSTRALLASLVTWRRPSRVVRARAAARRFVTPLCPTLAQKVSSATRSSALVRPLRATRTSASARRLERRARSAFPDGGRSNAGAGSPNDPACNPDHFCSQSSSDLAVCRATCDPLLQDCGVGQGCYGLGSWFACCTNLKMRRPERRATVTASSQSEGLDVSTSELYGPADAASVAGERT